MSGRENSLCLFALRSKTTESTCIAANVDSCLLLKICQAEIDNSVVKVFTTQMSVTVSGFYLKDTIFNSQERDIESATTKVKN
jgi:hypothetical protein